MKPWMQATSRPGWSRCRPRSVGISASDVPCGTCTACCTSSQFVHIGPDETDTLAHIPASCCSPRRGLPRGHVLMGYDHRGHCPMLVDRSARSTSTDRRPVARTTAVSFLRPVSNRTTTRSTSSAGRDVGGSDFPTEDDRTQHAAVRRAARYLGEHPEVVPGGVVSNATQHAVQAVEAHAMFLARGEPAPEAVRVELSRRPRPGERRDM